MIQGVIIKELGQNLSISVKKRGIDEGANLFIYVINIYKYRSLVRKLIRNLRIFITNKNIGKK